MRQVTKTIDLVTFNEASEELKDKIRENFATIYDIYDHCMNERIDTLKKVAKILNGSLEYSISCVPNRGEYIKIIPKNESLDFDSFWQVINQDKDCPLTGVCYDHDILDQFTEYTLNESKLQEVLNDYIDSIHNEYESMLEDDYLQELCKANEYEFTIDGEIY